MLSENFPESLHVQLVEAFVTKIPLYSLGQCTVKRSGSPKMFASLKTSFDAFGSRLKYSATDRVDVVSLMMVGFPDLGTLKSLHFLCNHLPASCFDNEVIRVVLEVCWGRVLLPFSINFLLYVVNSLAFSVFAFVVSEAALAKANPIPDVDFGFGGNITNSALTFIVVTSVLLVAVEVKILYHQLRSRQANEGYIDGWRFLNISTPSLQCLCICARLGMVDGFGKESKKTDAEIEILIILICSCQLSGLRIACEKQQPDVWK